MSQLLLLSLFALAAPPGAQTWEFKDAAQHDGRQVEFFRIVELAEKPPRPLDPDDEPGKGARHGLLKVGTKRENAVGIVWLAEKKQLWIDCNGDGRFDKTERLDFSTGSIDVDLEIAPDQASRGKRAKRTVQIRKQNSGEGLLWAVRGYTIGRIELNGKQFSAMLVDGNADGCFDAPNADRLWIDLDGDGKFDGLTEQFLIGTPVAVDGKTYLIKPDADGLGVQVRERPTERGAVRLTLGKKAVKLESLSAQLVGEWGDLIVIDELDKPMPALVGRYRIDGLVIKLRDDRARLWTYRFEGQRDYNLKVAEKKELQIALLDEITFDVAAQAPQEGIIPGASVNLTLSLRIAAGLELVDSRMDEHYANSSPEADTKLFDSGNTLLDRTTSGFF